MSISNQPYTINDSYDVCNSELCMYLHMYYYICAQCLGQNRTVNNYICDSEINNQPSS